VLTHPLFCLPAVQSVYYFIFAASLFVMLPSGHLAVQLHIGFMTFAAVLYAIISFSAPVSREREQKKEQ
jgi:hypothetical protein